MSSTKSIGKSKYLKQKNDIKTTTELEKIFFQKIWKFIGSVGENICLIDRSIA